MTLDQTKCAIRIENLIKRTTTASLMNDTKWVKLFTGFTDEKLGMIQASYKLINSDFIYGPSHLNWKETIEIGQFKLYEWFKLHYGEKIHMGSVAWFKQVDHRDDILAYLNSIHVGYSDEGDGAVIKGYLKSV